MFLFLIYFIAKYYLRNDLTPTDGIYLLIHNTSESPDLDSKLIRIRPQTLTSIGLSLKNLDRLKSPYTSDCTDTFPAEFNVSAFTYTETFCKSECRARYIYSTCGCWHPYIIPAKVRF